MVYWLLNQSENSLNYIKNIQHGYIAGAIWHLSHRGKTTLSKVMTL